MLTSFGKSCGKGEEIVVFSTFFINQVFLLFAFLIRWSWWTYILFISYMPTRVCHLWLGKHLSSYWVSIPHFTTCLTPTHILIVIFNSQQLITHHCYDSYYTVSLPLLAIVTQVMHPNPIMYLSLQCKQNDNEVKERIVLKFMKRP